VIEGVLEHNRWDLVSLAALMGQAVWLLQEGPLACREPSEQLALGRIFRQHGRIDDARFAYESAANGFDRNVRRQALAEIALLLRREQRHDEAAEKWQEVLDLGRASSMSSSLDRLAAEALAIHHEHRRKDPATATTYAELLGEGSGSTGAAGKVQHRLARLKRKVDRADASWWSGTER
jgi:tetratricopeptide (TPR) repeat protein